MKYMNFVLTGDANYVMPISVVITSILKNLGPSEYTPRFFLFTTDFKERNIDKINEVSHIKKCKIINIPMEKYLHYFDCVDTSKFTLQYVSLVCYYRLLLFKILPEDVDKCFYVDGDMIIDTDLTSLYRDMPEDKLLAAVVEVLAMQRRKDILSHFTKYSSLFKTEPLKYPYFNAGFFLANIKMAKKCKLFEQFIDFINNNPNPPYADQDTLNAICGQKYQKNMIYLPPEYNVFCSMYYKDKFDDAYYPKDIIQKAFAKPKIYHYGGPDKPWINRKIMHYWDIWWKYCRISPFKYIKKPKNYEFITYTKLFGLLPLFKYRKTEHSIALYLFDFIPLFKYKHKTK